MSQLHSVPWSVLAATGLIAALLCGCLESDKDAPVPMGLTVTKSRSTYSLGNAAIAITRDEQRICDRDSLVVLHDSGWVDSVIYRLRGDTLLLANGYRVVVGVNASPPDSVRWRLYFILKREDSGTGLEGLWRMCGRTDTLLHGTPTAAMLKKIASEYARAQVDYAAYPVTLRFDGSELTHAVGMDLAGEYIRNWNKPNPESKSDSSQWFVSVTALNDTCVQLHGLKTGEKVRIALGANGSRHFTSGNPSRIEYRYQVNPVSCPNYPSPDWFYDFLVENPRVAAPVVPDPEDPWDWDWD